MNDPLFRHPDYPCSQDGKLTSGWEQWKYSLVIRMRFKWCQHLVWVTSDNWRAFADTGPNKRLCGRLHWIRGPFHGVSRVKYSRLSRRKKS